MNLKGKRALVVGLGKSGLAAVRFLARRGAIVSAADSRPREDFGVAIQELAGLPVTLQFGGHPEATVLSHDIVVPSPGVPWDLPSLARARELGIPVFGELELAADRLRGRAIGVTGTNGKTTTASLIDHVLRASGVPGSLAGNIGTPVLEIVENSRPGEWHVLELSSFQLEAAESFRCHVAAVLNVTPDHLDRHGTFEHYAGVKARILRNQRPGDFAILNADDPECVAMESRVLGSLVRFGATRQDRLDGYLADGRIVFRGADISGSNLPIKGAHNLENALAAVAACSLAGLSSAAIGRALESFRPVPHRMEFVAKVRGVDYYNDSKATNVAAAVKACGSFSSGLWPILGGSDKGLDYAPLASALKPRTREALLVGEAAPLIQRQLDSTVPTVDAGTIRAALDYALSRALPGDTVLLAPACASFDQYPNYVERGREFRRLVESLVA